MCLDEAQQDLAEQRHVLMKAGACLGLESIHLIELATQAIEIGRSRREQAQHQIARIPRTRMRADQSGLRQQIVELKKEFRRVVARRMKREGLREETFESSLALRGFESNLPSMEGESEAEGQIEALDAKLESGQSGGRGPGERLWQARPRQLEHPLARILTTFIVGLDRLRQGDDALRKCFRPRPAPRSHAKSIPQKLRIRILFSG